MVSDILIIICALLMQFVGANPNLQRAERIVAALQHVDPHYKQDVLIIIAIESGFNEKATSSVGARGLMQLMPIAVKDVIQRQLCGITQEPADIYNIEDNIKFGSCFYEFLMLQFKNRDEALAFYNGGTPAVEALRRGEPFPETALYLKRFKTLEAKLPISQKGN